MGERGPELAAGGLAALGMQSAMGRIELHSEHTETLGRRPHRGALLDERGLRVLGKADQPNGVQRSAAPDLRGREGSRATRCGRQVGPP